MVSDDADQLLLTIPHAVSDPEDVGDANLREDQVVIRDRRSEHAIEGLFGRGEEAGLTLVGVGAPAANGYESDAQEDRRGEHAQCNQCNEKAIQSKLSINSMSRDGLLRPLHIRQPHAFVEALGDELAAVAEQEACHEVDVDSPGIVAWEGMTIHARATGGDSRSMNQ